MISISLRICQEKSVYRMHNRNTPEIDQIDIKRLDVIETCTFVQTRYSRSPLHRGRGLACIILEDQPVSKYGLNASYVKKNTALLKVNQTNEKIAIDHNKTSFSKCSLSDYNQPEGLEDILYYQHIDK